MALENKKMVAKLFLAALGFHFLTEVVRADTDLDQIRSNNDIDKQKVEKNVTIASSKKNPQAKKPTIQTFPQAINYSERLELHESHRKINEIHVSGNLAISKDSIVNRLPLKVGDEFNVNYTATMIKNLYSLGLFHQIQIYAETLDSGDVDLYIVVQEKPKLHEITFVGNKALSEKELKDELKADKIATLEQEELKALIAKIKKFYRKKNYHHVNITAQLSHGDDGKVSAEFTIKEGKKSYLNRISFKGNKQIPSKKLKRVIFSKEDWIGGLLDHSGTYSPEMSEGDKYMIEEIYKNNGFVNAKVTDTQVYQDPVLNDYHITYTISEGDRYTINKVNIEGNDLVTEERLRQVIPLREGQIYSLENIRTSLENLRMIWGEHGYLFADIEPSIDIDDEKKTVSVSFNSDLKQQVYLNRLTIRGNKKTRDKVIRRQILLDEGALITNQKMELSKACVGLLNYFDPKGGVNWKTIRIDDTHADLDLVVNEVKTGHFNANLSFGGSPTSRATPQTGLSFSLGCGDRNFMGSGFAFATSAEISKKYRAFMASASNPWIFDRPIRGTVNGFIKSSEYDDEITIAENAPLERAIGGVFGMGYFSKLLGGVAVNGEVNIERIIYENKIKAAKRLGAGDMVIAQLLLDKNFQTGNQLSFIGTMSQDQRNGIAFVTHGHQWSWITQLTVPGSTQCAEAEHPIACQQVATALNPQFNYFKTEFDISWYTPLINEHDLVLGVHGNLGFIHPFEGKDIPWKQLYHVGGPKTIRGYTYGQVGPNWKDSSLGATKAFNVNVEFIVPISSDLNTRGVIFYDGGAGWDTPYRDEFSITARNAGLSFEKDFINNNFFYRHSIGIGIRIKSPTPLQVDFGIKLNPSKRFKNELTQMHLNMEQSF
ncbi:MAG: outer membrane protein assembly factor BamA [Candidatus Dependentiae bacterium]|nr:outer membrane protein assembly factor BamA [Candidatus Dependentiae bacterium]